MRKIIFLDVDGTLVDYHNRIPESAIRAIRQARENGHLVYVCTGRSRAEMQPELWEIGLDGMIGGNGSYVEHQGQVIMHQLLSEEDSRAIVDWLHERGLEFYLESNNGLFASENFRERARETLQIYSMNKGKTAEEVANQEVEDVIHGMVFDGELYRDDLNKVSFVLDSYQDHLDSKQAFPQLVANTWGGRGESALFGDLGVKDIDKAHAISVLLNHLGASQADTIAFGDAKIDISMLDYCAVGVAMGNGGAEILAMADMITDDVEEDGLYNAFERLGLLDK
ncbi:Cof-type HAD-IIB family hydrolase [Streptococcus suis]|uniref:Cof-type HAD-IIB family hydrolase n=1 Tax=Streptococcus suis TaxID=1307 RepID=UPI0005CD663C|nr:Cof-type HAD-IIB family hydrolase [Streptococcus suis]MDY7284290.1 Cof-type HAD-IIB family hydrolase [Streptococcus suis]NQG77274.1 Cof-type HAD-IIB family hydrolase [Streptococcus suis]NQH60061.1 Cof-type HAD-IIB family hydrolase [Streptococcus suis]NQN47726.1 Cof-type HAD-IIB family hydrolase [Streptococcus suis]NQN55758.1 Cof-type HAD-IIB family hydrolase [Streptococcus suis]